MERKGSRQRTALLAQSIIIPPALLPAQAIVQFGGQMPPGPAASDFIKLPLVELHSMAQGFTPQCFFADAALPLSPPEAPVAVEKGTAAASSTDGARTADKALDEQR